MRLNEDMMEMLLKRKMKLISGVEMPHFEHRSDGVEHHKSNSDSVIGNEDTGNGRHIGQIAFRQRPFNV